MLANELSYELSIRLGDPIPIDENNASTDGIVFSGEQRLRYISRAYSKLMRMLKILMRDYQPEFNKRRKVTEIEIDGTTHTIPIPNDENFVKVEEVYVSYEYGSPKKVAVVPATYMEPSKYLTNKYDPNDVKGNSFEDGKIKYTVTIWGNTQMIQLLPIPTTTAHYTKIEVLNIPDFKITNWGDNVPIAGDYIDLLIDLAAIQGMQDIARADKAQLISQSIQADWQILGQYGTYMKQTEGVQE